MIMPVVNFFGFLLTASLVISFVITKLVFVLSRHLVDRNLLCERCRIQDKIISGMCIDCYNEHRSHQIP